MSEQRHRPKIFTGQLGYVGNFLVEVTGWDLGEPPRDQLRCRVVHDCDLKAGTTIICALDEFRAKAVEEASPPPAAMPTSVTAWIIEEDFLADKGFAGQSRVGRGVNTSLPMQYRWRTLDDDGIVYYLGRSNDRDSFSAFDPLDYAGADAGCTEIQYWYDDVQEWKTL